jgi:NAD(P)-dependent dehydrogenase (short-subunit alcohol dehydrogenase family)
MSSHPAFEGKHVVITGAASGIGRATAVKCANRGAIVHLTDRNETPLKETAEGIRTAGGRVGVVTALDIRDIDAVREFAAQVHAVTPQADMVMNIAGVSAWGSVDRLSHEQWQSMVDINLMGPIHVIEAFVPAMIAGGRGGHLVNVSSAAGLFGLPWHAAYSASKFGLRGVSEVLRFDLRRHKIGVHLVCPGGVDTPLTATVEVAGADTTSKSFARLQKQFRRHAVSPERAAAAILHGVTANRYLVFTSGDIRLLYYVQKFAPHIYNLVMRIMNAGMNRAMPLRQP